MILHLRWRDIFETDVDILLRMFVQISLMMEKDAYRRVTPKEALEHPFLRDANTVLEDLFREQQPINPTRLL